MDLIRQPELYESNLKENTIYEVPEMVLLNPQLFWRMSVCRWTNSSWCFEGRSASVFRVKQFIALRSLETWVNVTSVYGVISQKTRALTFRRIMLTVVDVPHR